MCFLETPMSKCFFFLIQFDNFCLLLGCFHLLDLMWSLVWLGLTLFSYCVFSMCAFWGFFLSFLKKIFFNVYLFLRQRETEHERGRVREREGDTESETGSRLWAVSTEPDAGLKLMDRELVTWAEVGCPTDWATQTLMDAYLQCIVLKWYGYMIQAVNQSRKGLLFCSTLSWEPALMIGCDYKIANIDTCICPKV